MESKSLSDIDESDTHPLAQTKDVKQNLYFQNGISEDGESSGKKLASEVWCYKERPVFRTTVGKPEENRGARILWVRV